MTEMPLQDGDLLAIARTSHMNCEYSHPVSGLAQKDEALNGSCHGQKCIHLFSDSEAYHTAQMEA